MQRALRRQGLSEATRDSYARALRRLQAQVEVPLDQLGVSHLKDYFSKLIESHSWSTVKVDRCGLQFFYLHLLERDWNWVRIVRPPRAQQIPNILSQSEVVRLLRSVRERRYRTYLFTTYSLGLRLSEALATLSQCRGAAPRLPLRCVSGQRLTAASLRPPRLSALPARFGRNVAGAAAHLAAAGGLFSAHLYPAGAAARLSALPSA